MNFQNKIKIKGLDYRENDYFDESKTYVFYDSSINKYRVCKVENYNGYFFSLPNTGGPDSTKLGIKMTSVPSCELSVVSKINLGV